ncbi:MAG: type II toxin-antitoxin system VapC family toxin [Myxococcales bacterium]|nr:MAG: type II toxin-antitoxin system VapC family toxin [Myxococcales bacterium]
MSSHLLDTDVCIDVLRGRDDALEAQIRALTDVTICSVTVAELEYGAARSSDPDGNRRAVERLLAAVDVIALDKDGARHAGEIRAGLTRRGTPIGGYDLLIAGVARSRNSVLVTRNLKEFRRVVGLELLDLRS